MSNIDFKIKGYGTESIGRFSAENQIEFEILNSGKSSYKILTKEFMSKILLHSFEIEKFIESSIAHT